MTDIRRGRRQLAAVLTSHREALLDQLTELEWAADPERTDVLVRGREVVRPRAALFLDVLIAGLENDDWAQFDTVIGSRTVGLLRQGVVTPAALNDRALRVASLLIPIVARGSEGEAALLALFGTMQALSTRIIEAHSRHLLEESQRLDDLKTMFLRLTGHELRAPLGTIRGYASMLTEGDLGELPDGARQAISAIDQAAGGALGMIDRLVEVARLESGGEALQRARTELREIVDGALDTLRDAAALKGLGLTSEVADGTADVDLEETRIAVRNLVGNAIKYGSPGGGVVVRARPDDGGAVIEVEDDGPGIAAEELGQIFDRYYRSQSSRRSSVTGSGLGLYITKRIADLHGGDVTVTSEPGKGSRFVLRLPGPRPPQTLPAAGA